MIAFQRKHDFFIGVDSDGCVFDSMEPKHKECFIPAIIEHYRLAAVSKCAREVGEFVNLYSQHRGINRFPGLVLTMDLLRQRPEVRQRGVEPPRLAELRQWCATTKSQANAALQAAIEQNGSAELRHCMTWSLAVNESIDRIVRDVPPFPHARPCLEEMANWADVMVVSGTPTATLQREWREHGLDHLVAGILGQEFGKKSEMLALANQYPTGHALMIGDAPADGDAAQKCGALFFPIIPGEEDECWAELLSEGLPRFRDGRFAGAYEQARVERFAQRLPAEPSWAVTGP